MPLLSQTRRLSDCDNCQYRSLRKFCNLSPDAFADFNKMGTSVTLPKGAHPFREGDRNHGVLVVCSGTVKLSCTSNEGKTLILKIALPGDVLGIGAVISGSPYEVTAETLETTVLKNIGRDEFLRFLEKHGEASMHAATALSGEYKAVFFEARRLALSSSAAGRVAAVLLDWGRAATPQMRFTMALTHEELGNLAGTTRETVTRTFGKLQKDKLIQVRGATIVIVAPDRLAELSA